MPGQDPSSASIRAPGSVGPVVNQDVPDIDLSGRSSSPEVTAGVPDVNVARPSMRAVRPSAAMSVRPRWTAPKILTEFAWDRVMPNGQYTYLGYWAKRVYAYLEQKRALSGQALPSFTIGSVTSWLRNTYSDAANFESRALWDCPYLVNPSGQNVVQPAESYAVPGYWYARSIDPQIAYCAGELFLAPPTPCQPGVINEVKPYRYVVQPGDTPYLVAKMFTGNGTRWTELRSANHDDPHGFARDQYGVCNWRVWSGKELKVPASWPDPAYGSALDARLVQTGTGAGAVASASVDLIDMGAVNSETGEPVNGDKPKDEGKGMHPAWWVAIAGLVGLGGYGIYRAVTAKGEGVRAGEVYEGCLPCASETLDDPEQMELYDSLWLIMQNDGVAYADFARARSSSNRAAMMRATQEAAKRAFRDYTREVDRNRREDYRAIEGKLARDLAKYWSRRD